MPSDRSRPTAARQPDGTVSGSSGSGTGSDQVRQWVHTAARQALYTAVGAGVLAFQRTQVARRRLEQSMAGYGGEPESPGAAVTGAAAQVQAVAAAALMEGAAHLRRAAQAADSVDRSVDAVLDRVEELLPPGPRAALAQSRANTRQVRRVAATLLGLTIRTDRPAPAERPT